MHPDLLDELSQPPHLIVVRGRQRVQRLAQRAYERGELIRPLPGIYALPESEGLQAQAVAVNAYDPDAVITGSAAAALVWWPELAAPVMDVASAAGRVNAPGYRFTRRRVPPELMIESNGIRLTNPALTVLDMIPDMGGAAIDEALRRSAVTLDDLWEAMALTPNRRGNAERAWLLHDSRDEQWSHAERGLQRRYRGLDLPWEYRTNHPVALPSGMAFLDLAIPELELDFEVDGYEVHTTREAFVRDRVRGPELVEAGWLVVGFAATTVEDDPVWVDERMRGIIAARAIERGVTPRGRNRSLDRRGRGRSRSRGEQPE